MACADVDECTDAKSNNCQYRDLCINTQGSYQCNCPVGYHGDGRTDGEECMVNSNNKLPVIQIALGNCLLS